MRVWLDSWVPVSNIVIRQLYIDTLNRNVQKLTLVFITAFEIPAFHWQWRIFNGNGVFITHWSVRRCTTNVLDLHEHRECVSRIAYHVSCTLYTMVYAPSELDISLNFRNYIFFISCPHSVMRQYFFLFLSFFVCSLAFCCTYVYALALHCTTKSTLTISHQVMTSLPEFILYIFPSFSAADESNFCAYFSVVVSAIHAL